MAVLGRLLVSSAERLDLPDLLSLDSYAAGDWKYFLKGLVGDSKPYILKGFDVIDPGNAIGTQSCSIRVADSVTFYPGSNSGSFFHGLEENNVNAAPLVPELRKNAVNYVYLTFTTANTSVDTRAFWDPDKDGGVGGEFTQDVNTESVLQVQVNVSTGSFPANTVPVAKITVGPVVITAIEDARDLMFRLGSGGINPNPFNTYGWRSSPSAGYERQEPPTQMLAGGVNPFQGADKNILTLKEWMDAIMSKLRELGGTTYWYDDTSSFSIITNFYDAVATAFKSKGKWVHDTITPGLLTWTEDIQIKMTSDPRTYIIRQGSRQLADEQVMYIPMERDLSFSGTDESVSWINGQTYVNTIGGAVGLFANLSKGDYIKKANDTIDKWVRVEEFYDAVNMGGSTTTAAGARSVRLGSAYLGVTGAEKGRYDKGVYLSTDLVVSDRDSAAIGNIGGNFHWLAIRSDTIDNIANIVTTNLAVDIDQHDGSTARVTSVAHGLVDGDRITIAGTTNFDGTYEVEVETTDIFYITVSGGPFADESGTAHYATVTTSARTTPYGFQEESANHGFNSGDSVAIGDTTNYDGLYKVNVRSATVFTIPVAGPTASETAGTATLARVIVRTEGAVAQLIQGQVVNIGGNVAENIRLYIGMNSLSETAPSYSIPVDYNTLDGMQNYNGVVNENLTARISKLTAMMADKTQDKTVKYLPSNGITTITNTTNGAAQELSFAPSGASITILTPSSDGQTFVALPSAGSPLSLLVNQSAYVQIDRNNPSTVSIAIADTVDVPLEENTFVVAARLNTPDIYIWDGSIVVTGSQPAPNYLGTVIAQNQTMKLIEGGTWSWATTPSGTTILDENLTDGITGSGSDTVGFLRAQAFTVASPTTITQINVRLRATSPATGNQIVYIVPQVAGEPDESTVLFQSNPVNLATLTNTFSSVPFTIASPGILAPGNYFIYTAQVHANVQYEYYGVASSWQSTNGGTTWFSGVQNFGYEILQANAVSGTVTWNQDAYVQIPGLADSVNTIPAGTAILANDGDVAYVQLNRATPGGILTVAVTSAATLALTSNTSIIARREGDDVIVGLHSMRLVNGESKKIYAATSNQTLSFIGATGAADSAPNYTSNNYVTDGTSLVTAISTLDSSLSTAVASIRWKEPVANFAALPASSNTNGDVRLTLDTNIAYRWNSSLVVWIEIGYWKSPVSTFGSLPVTNNSNGDMRLALDTRIIYSWNSTSSTWIPASGSGGFVKVDFINPISTTLPTGSSVTIDGVAGVNGDLVLFTNLSSNNNRIYLLGGVGTSITWTPQLSFNGTTNPSSGDSVIARKGLSFTSQVSIFNGTNFLVNNVVRLFNGVSADFWELGSLKTSSLSDNTTGNVFTVAFAGSENMTMNYSIIRGSIKEVGQILITTDGTNVSVAKTSSYLGDTGVTFTGQISGANIQLNYSTTNTGSAATLKYFISRWSDSAGGPTGVPSYSGSGGGSVTAAGINTDIQYNNAGTLGADSRFQWDSSVGALKLNSMQYTSLSSSLTINDNQVSYTGLFTYTASTFPSAIIEYSVERGGENRTGRMLISNNGTNVGFSDDFVETSPTGVNFQAIVSGPNIMIQYTSTSTGSTGTLKYTMRRWS